MPYIYAENNLMPLQWKIYYWCSVYVLLWCVISFCFSVYVSFLTLPSLTEVLNLFVIALILSVVFFSAWQCAQVIKHYQNNKALSNKSKLLFKVAFISQILITAFLCLFFYLFIEVHYFNMQDENYESQPWLDYERVVPDFLNVLMAIASLYNIFLHLPLLKAIGQNQHSNATRQLQ